MGRRKDLNLDDQLQEAVDNIRKDRTIIHSLLADLIVYMKQDKAAHKDCGLIASKYVETLQRSNEQLVKVNNLLYKKTAASQDLTDVDKSHLFDMIKSEDEG